MFDDARITVAAGVALAHQQLNSLIAQNNYQSRSFWQRCPAWEVFSPCTSSSMFLRAQKARQEEYRMVANRLLQLVGGQLGAKRDDSNKVVIGIGPGQFSSTMRLSSLHGTFQKYVMQQARSLEYILVGVNEYYTSQRCPICEDFVEQVDLRRLYCSTCKVFMHRNVMAGHNNCKVVQAHLWNQKRPQYLQPRDADYSTTTHGKTRKPQRECICVS